MSGPSSAMAPSLAAPTREEALSRRLPRASMSTMDEGQEAVSETHPSPDSVPDDGTPAPTRRRSWLPRNVKITLMVLFLFFVGEYVLLPELASARREFHQLRHLNFLWLVLGTLLELAALAAYAELTRHRPLPRRAAPLARLPHQHVGARRQPRPAGRNGAGNRGQLPAAHRVRRLGEHGRLRPGRPGHRLGRRAQRHLLALAPHLHPAPGLQPALRVRRHPGRPAPGDLRRPRASCSPGARSRRPLSSARWRSGCRSSGPKR